MTLKEAIKQAWRERGASEQEINYRTKYAQAGIPLKDVEIPQGKEREIIEVIKATFSELDRMSAEQMAKVDKQLEIARAKLNTSN